MPRAHDSLCRAVTLPTTALALTFAAGTAAAHPNHDHAHHAVIHRVASDVEPDGQPYQPVTGERFELFAEDAPRFRVIGLPDTQKYSEEYPLIFNSQIDWVVANAGDLDLAFVSHFGDVVQHGTGPLSLNEYTNAAIAMAPLYDSDIPFGICSGNHDVTESGTSGQPFDETQFLAFFGPHTLMDKPFFGGASPSGLSTFQLFSAGGLDFIAIHLTVDNPLAEITWAHQVLAAYRDRPAMISTHRYMQDADDYVPDGLEIITSLFVSSGRYPNIWYSVEGLYDPTGTFAENFWASFVRTNRNIFWVNCGHFHEQHRQTSNNVWGMPVREVLADYQDDPNGGNGWLRIMTFDTDAEVVEVDSYSPYLNKFIAEAVEGDTSVEPAEGSFVYDVEFTRYGAPGYVSFQQGVNGYTGTQDTWINEDSTGSSYGASDVMEVDNDITNSIFSDRTTQAFVRFDDLFTTTDELGKVPTGATILDATLRMEFNDDVDIGSEDMRVYVANRSWNESSTWSSLGSGFSGSELGAYLGEIDGDDDPDGDGARIINVTSAVQAWANGATNYGFVLLPEDTSNNDDGMTVWSSEASIVFRRPVLDVVYQVLAPSEPCNMADLAEPFATLNFADVQTFLGAFGASQPAADLAAPSGVYNFADVQTFLAFFGAGCP